MSNITNTTIQNALPLEAIVNAISHGGTERTVLVQGHMGIGKTAIGYLLAERMPTHKLCYFDCTTKDVADVLFPKLSDLDGGEFVRFVPNEELGVHLNQPVILMIDEFGKNRAIQNQMMRLMLERRVGSYALHEDSIVLATTNLGQEGVGDMLQPHHRNRITVLTMRKPSNLEWIEWGINNGVDPVVLGWAREFPQAFNGFEMHTDPEENPYIYHPKSVRTAFVTPRSLKAASDWTKLRAHFDTDTLRALLVGTIGERAASDMFAYIDLANQLPTTDEIRNAPLTAKVPTSPSAVCMVVFRALGMMERKFVAPWMQYLNRLEREAQALFACSVTAPSYSRKGEVMTTKEFQQFALANAHLSAADKK